MKSTLWTGKRMPSSENTIRSRWGDDKLVLRLDGEDWVFAKVGINVMMVTPASQKIPISWLIMQVEREVKAAFDVAGGIIHGGTIELCLRDVGDLRIA